MLINYLGEEVIKTEDKKSIFLAGPIAKNKCANSWRESAIEILKKLGFDGIVYNPECYNISEEQNKEFQIDWEMKALENTGIIIFWVPAEVKNMQTLLTDYNFGVWYDISKVLYGREKGMKMQYLDYKYCRYSNKLPYENLEHLLENAVKQIV